MIPLRTQAIAVCPVCSGELGALDIAKDYDIRALDARITIEFAICANCGFVCQSRFVPLDALMRYYQDSPKLRDAVPTDTLRALYGAQAAFMESAGVLRGTRVLDIGADMGKLLDYLLERYDCETYYEEENRTAKGWLSETHRHTDYRVADRAVPLAWIVLSQVLEHIVDPVPFLATLRERLGAQGKLFIEVPHHGAWDDLDLGFFFEHVNYFSPATLTAALDRAGFNLLSLQVTTDPHYFEGRGRIIRACAQIRSPDLMCDAVNVVRAHDRRQKLDRLVAVEVLSRSLQRSSRRGLAVYGAGELTDLVHDHLVARGEALAAIFDTDPRKHGMPIGDLIVQPPEAILACDPPAILILSSAEANIRQTIAAVGFTGRVICWSELSHV